MNFGLPQIQGMNKNKPKILILAGPTASGKTGLAIELAQRFNCEIVSADSIQIYRYMDIGSAKPTPSELAQAPHHMIDIRDPDQDFSAGDYLREARSVISDILEKGKVPLVVGGTGLYIRTLTGGIAEIPPADHELRKRLRDQEESEGAGSLFKKLCELDLDAAELIPPQNLARIIRSLEVIALTGRSLKSALNTHLRIARITGFIFASVLRDRFCTNELINELTL